MSHDGAPICKRDTRAPYRSCARGGHTSPSGTASRIGGRERLSRVAHSEDEPHNPRVPRTRPKSRPQLPIVSLFSGPGGLDLGFHEAGFDTVLAADFSTRAVDTYNHNLAAVAQKLDLATTAPEVLVQLVRETGVSPRGVIGGPPCQSFSQANVRQRRNDPRTKLIFRYADFVEALDEEFSIDFFLMENVAALAKPKYRPLLDKLKNRFRRGGFEVYEDVLNARDYGVAQRRRRLFLVGIKRDLAGFAAFQFPAGTDSTKTVRSEIAHLPRPTYFDRSRTTTSKFHPNHWTMMPYSAKFRSRSATTGRSFRRLQWDSESPAVAYGHREIHVHPSGQRRLSILEALLLQGFPQRYELKGNLSEQVTQVSDAVPPPLAKAIATAIRESLYNRRTEVQTALLRFFAHSGRDFPWRHTSNTFHLLIAEKLLQQTAARDVVVAAYRAIVKQWPTPAALARANLAELRSLVQPLGLPYRANELIALAATIERTYNGVVPRERSALLALPGVGEYAADAVLSFSGHAETAVVDTNVSRLLHRMFGLRSSPSPNPARSKHLKNLATWLGSGAPSRSLNYATLDFTATVCVARTPVCGTCPLRTCCARIRTETTTPVVAASRG